MTTRVTYTEGSRFGVVCRSITNADASFMLLDFKAEAHAGYLSAANEHHVRKINIQVYIYIYIYIY